MTPNQLFDSLSNVIMLRIRLTRTGKTKRPHYRVVVMEHTSAAQGPYVAALGIWDPLTHKLEVDEGELKMWMDRGAKPTDRISRLLKSKGMKHKLIQIHERPAHGPKKKTEKQEEPKAAEGQAEAPATAAETPAETSKAAETPATETAETPAEKSAPESQPTDQEVAVKETTPAVPVEPAAPEEKS